MKKMLVLAALSLGSASAASTCSALDNIVDTKVTSLKFIATGTDGKRLYDPFAFEMDISYRNLDTYLSRLNQAFARNGTSLFLALVPKRGSVEMKYLDPTNPNLKNFKPEVARQNYQNYMKFAAASGIKPIDLLSTADRVTASGQQFYYLRDMHWTDTGAKAAAEAVAQVVRPSVEGYEDSSIKLVPAPSKSMMTLGAVANQLCPGSNFTPEPSPQVSLTLEEDLLSENYSPLVILGDSYGNNVPDSNFAAYLSDRLRVPVDNESIIAGSLDASMLTYARKYTALEDKPKAALWLTNAYQLNEHFLRQAIPAYYGVCKSPILKKDNLTGPVSIDMTGAEYLVVQVDKFAEPVTFTNSTATGNQKSVLSPRTRRADVGNTYYYDYKDRPVPAINVSLNDASVLYSVTTCKYPN